MTRQQLFSPYAKHQINNFSNGITVPDVKVSLWDPSCICSRAWW
jgi:hypothetical protein